MRSDEKLDAPGLKRRGKKKERLHWVARADIARDGYLPKTVRLHYDEAVPAHRWLIEAACHKLQAEMLEWASGKRNTVRPFDGTLGSLVRCYQTDEASPYRQIKWNTQRTYDQVLSVVEKAFGTRSLSALGIADFRKWYDAAKAPRAKGEPERVRKAHGIISMIRRLMAYGIAAEHAECGRLAAILDASRFKQPGRRRVRLELHHVEAFVAKALELGRLSLAIGTAVQFETLMRQRDVIGEWEPIRDGEKTGIVLNDRRWVNGLTWSDLANNLEVFKDTTKTGQTVAHDLKLIPMVVRLLDMVPTSRRVGPLIIDEEAQRPYAMHGYTREWRKVATAAGIPTGLWNMDARAGGISEADDSGADLDDIRSTAGHSQASTTVNYIRGGMGKSRKVTKGRQASRTVKNGTET
ncbi:integrase [Tardiphaga sp. vice278]|uniref:integrase n=1 Tax=Tardiphaga sp. vice278 TaxID=2592815 RepID=UPI0011620CA7|nr:integrase [Tardiphaga sp. vice278]QDM14598.1 integrase [Tardiphaga sp. vice278]